MTETAARLDGLSRQIDDLQDLFKRRLLDDRDKRQQIESLQARLDASESARSAEGLRPIVTQLALVIERVDTAESATKEFLASVADELWDVIAFLGVSPITDEGGFDPRCHEVVRVDGGEGTRLEVTEVLRTGFGKDGVVLRPAQVAVRRSLPELSPQV